MLNWVRNFFKPAENIQPNTTQPNTTQPNTTQPNTTQPNISEEKKFEYREPSEAKQSSNGLDEAIRLEAYYLWEQDGKPEGNADYYWQKAAERVYQNRKEMAR